MKFTGEFLNGKTSFSDIAFITLTNTGYIEYTLNCLESLKRIGCERLPHCYCVGKDGYEILKRNGYDSTLIDDEQHSNFKKFKRGNWSAITLKKIDIIYENLLKHDYVCITDGDIVYENADFMKYLIENIGDNELLIQSEGLENGDESEMCTGFMLIRSNENTKDIFNPVHVENYKNNIEWEDQRYVNELKDRIRYKKLPLELYPNGRYYKANKDVLKPYMIHFNWIVGHQKKERMLDNGKWFI